MRRMWDVGVTSLVRPIDVPGTSRTCPDRVVTQDVPGTLWGFVDRILDVQMTFPGRPRPAEDSGLYITVQGRSLPLDRRMITAQCAAKALKQQQSCLAHVVGSMPDGSHDHAGGHFHSCITDLRPSL